MQLRLDMEDQSAQIVQQLESMVTRKDEERAADMASIRDAVARLETMMREAQERSKTNITATMQQEFQQGLQHLPERMAIRGMC